MYASSISSVLTRFLSPHRQNVFLIRIGQKSEKWFLAQGPWVPLGITMFRRNPVVFHQKEGTHIKTDWCDGLMENQSKQVCQKET